MRAAVVSTAVLSLVSLGGLASACGVEEDYDDDFVDVEAPLSVDLARANGSTTTRPIRNGTPTGAFPPVGLLFDSAAGRSCTGTLIGRDTVLTAAHCVKGSPASQLSFTLERGPVFSRSDLHEATAKKVHHSYREGVEGRVEEDGAVTLHIDLVGADLAVVKLRDRLGSVPRYALDGAGAAPGDVVRIVGYGQDLDDSGEKQVGKMRVDAIADGPKTEEAGYDESLLSLVPTGADQNTCPGDSGGPVLRTAADGSRKLSGVASFITFPAGTSSENVCRDAARAYYTDVARFSSWITAARGALSPAGSCVPKDDGSFATLGGGCKDKRTAKVWSRPRGARTRAQAVAFCRDLVEGGKSDWRLPAKRQLRVVAKHGAKSHLAGRADSFYWTRTLAAGGGGVIVRLADGAVRVAAKSKKRRVVCVRG